MERRIREADYNLQDSQEKLQEEIIALQNRIKMCDSEKQGMKTALAEYEQYLRKIVDNYNN